MKTLCFHSLLIFTLTLNEFKTSVSERRISQEEWQQMRFDGMGSGQWTMNMPDVDPETVVNSGNTQMDATLQTNIETVDVGRDKLVLVNDQGSIKMLRASQLPSVAKKNTEVTTQTPSTVIQMPLEQYLTKDSNQNPTKNPIEIISPNFGAGHRVAGLPVAFATSSNSMDRPNVVYQTDSNPPCVKASDNPPIYIPAPHLTATTSRSSDKKMVRIIIEMPESMTRNPDEASRYAATQVKRLRVSDDKPRRKIKKNVQEVIRKVVQTEEENDEPEEDYSGTSNGDMADEASNTSTQNNLIIAKTGTDDNNREKKYILVRKSGNLRRRDRRRNDDNLKTIDKYKKIIKVYRH